jgi:hypothetical protein
MNVVYKVMNPEQSYYDLIHAAIILFFDLLFGILVKKKPTIAPYTIYLLALYFCIL